jgi:hypothetical protein
MRQRVSIAIVVRHARGRLLLAAPHPAFGTLDVLLMFGYAESGTAGHNSRERRERTMGVTDEAL